MNDKTLDHKFTYWSVGGFYKLNDRVLVIPTNVRINPTEYTILNSHPEIKGEERVCKWYVNEIQDKSGKISRCSDDFIETAKKSCELIHVKDYLNQIKNYLNPTLEEKIIYYETAIKKLSR